MNIDYKNKKVEEQCKDIKRAKRDFPEKVAKKILKHITFIENADNLESIKNFTPFNFHSLDGDLNGFYALDVDGRRSPYRFLTKFEGYTKDDVFQNSQSIEIIEITEVSKHYEK